MSQEATTSQDGRSPRDELVDKLLSTARFLVLKQEFDLLREQDMQNHHTYTTTEKLLRALTTAASEGKIDGKLLASAVTLYFHTKNTAKDSRENYETKRREYNDSAQESGLSFEMTDSPIPAIVDRYIQSQQTSTAQGGTTLR